MIVKLLNTHPVLTYEFVMLHYSPFLGMSTYAGAFSRGGKGYFSESGLSTRAKQRWMLTDIEHAFCVVQCLIYKGGMVSHLVYSGISSIH